MKIPKKYYPLTLIYMICFLGTEADGALDKARKHKKRQLEDTLNLVMKKRKVTWVFRSWKNIH